jgi:hypothetical protein
MLSEDLNGLGHETNRDFVDMHGYTIDIGLNKGRGFRFLCEPRVV